MGADTKTDWPTDRWSQKNLNLESVSHLGSPFVGLLFIKSVKWLESLWAVAVTSWLLLHGERSPRWKERPPMEAFTRRQRTLVLGSSEPWSVRISGTAAINCSRGYVRVK
jgi:hypothetical protein